jgi:hypothetical protein
MVPPNTFTAKTFENKGPVTTTSSVTTVRKKKQKDQHNRKRKRAQVFDSCSRKARKDPTASIAESSRTNKLKPATVIQNCLMKYNNTITMTCGTLSTQLKNGLHDNNVGRFNNRELFRKEVLETINETVRIGTEVTRCAEQAIGLYISKVMAESTSLEDPDRRKQLSTLGFHKNSACFGNLLQELFSWGSRRIRSRIYACQR